MYTAQAIEYCDAFVSEASELEPRRGPRSTIYRVARLIIDDDAGFCRIHNISDFGALLITSLVVAPGQAIAISLSESIHLSGRAIWREDARLGIEFSEAIDAAAMLKTLAVTRQAGCERPTRLPTHVVAAAATPYGTGAITIRNISQQGMQVAHDGSFAVGMPVKVMMANGLERRGIVRWSSDRIAGLRLLEPMSHRELESVNSL